MQYSVPNEQSADLVEGRKELAPNAVSILERLEVIKKRSRTGMLVLAFYFRKLSQTRIQLTKLVLTVQEQTVFS